MHIFHDESGTFGKAKSEGAFCVVASYVLPETQYRKAKDVLRDFKLRQGKTIHDEVKRHSLGGNEHAYFQLLDALAQLDGIVVALGTDASTNENAGMHKGLQSAQFLERIDQMSFPEGKAAAAALAREVAALPDQNYVEMYCRVSLAWETIKRATMYYAQRRPGTLNKFRWCYDRKDVTRTPFEKTFARVAPIFLQSMALHDPLPRLAGANYSKLLRRSTQHRPDWLSLPESTKVDHLIDGGGIWREKLEFADSLGSPGVQLVDLIVNGIFGVLRGRFQDSKTAARLLGGLMVHPGNDAPLMPILRFSEGATTLIQDDAAALLRIMRSAARPMLVNMPPSAMAKREGYPGMSTMS